MACARATKRRAGREHAAGAGGDRRGEAVGDGGGGQLHVRRVDGAAGSVTGGDERGKIREGRVGRRDPRAVVDQQQRRRRGGGGGTAGGGGGGGGGDGRSRLLRGSRWTLSVANQPHWLHALVATPVERTRLLMSQLRQDSREPRPARLPRRSQRDRHGPELCAGQARLSKRVIAPAKAYGNRKALLGWRLGTTQFGLYCPNTAAKFQQVLTSVGNEVPP